MPVRSPRPSVPRFRNPRGPVLALAALALAGLVGAGCDGPPRKPTNAERAEPGPVFILGFDGLDPRLVEEWERQGLLPNFAKLRAAGAVGDVRSTIPMISPPAWTTVVTGTPPGDHGIWSFWVPDGDDARGSYVDATRRLAPALWEDLTAAGRTVGIVNVPVSSPPDSVRGFQIAGFPYRPGAPLTYPPELEREIVGRGWMRDAFLGPPEPGQEMAWLAEKRELARARREIALGLLFDRRPDLSFLVFTTPDRIQHHLWRFHDPEHPAYAPDAPEPLRHAVRDIYVWCDDVLGEVMERISDDTTLMVVSDHGFGPAYLGISKDRFVASLPERIRAKVATGGSLFGGEFYLDGLSDEDRETVIRALEAAATPAGRPVVRAVHEPKRVPTTGYGRDLGPDLVAEENDGFLFAPGSAAGALTGPLGSRSFSGWHRRLGYFGIYGRPVVAGPVRDLDLADVPAMAMHLLGEPIPRRYVHNFPRRVFPVSYFLERPMRFSGDVVEGLRHPGERGESGAPIDDAIAEQLRAIGYVD